jgi:hypothetical protein
MSAGEAQVEREEYAVKQEIGSCRSDLHLLSADPTAILARLQSIAKQPGWDESRVRQVLLQVEVKDPAWKEKIEDVALSLNSRN